MQALTCNLCGGDAYSVLFEAGVAQANRIVKCRKCGLLYANPRAKPPDVEQIRTWDVNWVLAHITTTDRWRLEKELLQVRDYRRTRKFLSRKHPNRGSFLEVGSGMGYLLNFFRQDGWTTTGVEPNAGLGAYARRELGLTVIDGTLEEAGLEPGSADVAIMMHVIEHVPDPASTLAAVYRILKPGGSFVLETPRYDTLMFRLLGRRERSVSCDGHIYFFTKKTLAQLTTNAGFRVLRIDCVGRSLSIDRLLYNIGVISKSKVFQRALKSLSARLRLNRLAITLNVRDMQRLYLEKPA